MKYLYSILIIVGLSFVAHSQTEHNNEEDLNEQEEKHSIGMFISHTFISQGFIDGDRKWLTAPSFALNYNYKLNDKWSIGLHNDIILESFLVDIPERGREDEIIERERPISNVIVGTYKITKPWGVAVGAGIDWEKNENFGLIRLGTDYGLELKKAGLEVLFTLNFDILIDAYDSFNFGLGITKFFK